MLGSKHAKIAGLLSLTAALFSFDAAKAQTLTPINVATFPFPSMTNIMHDVVIAKGFDKKHHLEAHPLVYGTAGALWAAVAKGELPAHNMGAYTLQNIREEGTKVRIFGTFVRLSSEQIITKNPDVKTFKDIKGKSFAAMTGYIEYDIVNMYARKLGIDLSKEANVINATPALARAQLEAGRADAALTWEPASTMILKDNKDARVLVNGDEMWKELTGEGGWEGYLVVRDDIVKEHPDIVKNMIGMYSDAAEFIRQNPDEADAIVTSGKYASKDIPPGTIASAIKSGHLYYEVLPSWDPKVNARIWAAFDVGLKYGVIKSMPPRDGVINDPPK